jgi:hypothetical protein
LPNREPEDVLTAVTSAVLNGEMRPNQQAKKAEMVSAEKPKCRIGIEPDQPLTENSEGTATERFDVQVIRMWPGGPLREVSSTARNSWIAHSRYGFAGRYVCERCREPVAGVYSSIHGGDWQCAGCRKVGACR